MEFLAYAARCLVVALVAWLSVRIIGRRTIAQMTSYDFAAIMVISNVAAEPLVYKVASKALFGSLVVAVVSMLIGWLSLRKWFYNLDAKPGIVIANGRILHDELAKNRINLPFLLSLLRLAGYANVAEVEYAILEPTGNLSVLPKSQDRPVRPKDLKLDTAYEGLALPLILDGEVQYNNLKYAKLSAAWLEGELRKAGCAGPGEVFLAELDSAGQLHVYSYQDKPAAKPGVF